MSAKLWFLQDIEDIMEQNREKFGIGKNSYYNLLFASAHIFAAGKYFEREAVLNQMMAIYELEKPKESHESHPIGFTLPSKKIKEGKLEFGLINSENVEKLRPIRNKNDKLNEQIFIIENFIDFLKSIDPRSQIFEDQYLLQLEGLFEDWWETQMKLRAQALENSKKENAGTSDKNVAAPNL